MPNWPARSTAYCSTDRQPSAVLYPSHNSFLADEGFPGCFTHIYLRTPASGAYRFSELAVLVAETAGDHDGTTRSKAPCARRIHRQIGDHQRAKLHDRPEMGGQRRLFS